MDRTAYSSPSPAGNGVPIVVIAPLVMLAAFLYHPFIPVLTRTDTLAEVVQADTLRWGLAHLSVAVGSALMVIAFISVRDFLVRSGARVGAHALSCVAFGGVLYAVLPGFEFSALAAAQTGGDIVRVEQVLEPWFLPTLFTGAIANAIGVFGFARAVRTAPVMEATQSKVVVIALVVMAVSRFIPLGAVQFYTQGVAGVVGLLTIAFVMRGSTTPARDLAVAGVRG